MQKRWIHCDDVYFVVPYIRLRRESSSTPHGYYNFDGWSRARLRRSVITPRHSQYLWYQHIYRIESSHLSNSSQIGDEPSTRLPEPSRCLYNIFFSRATRAKRNSISAQHIQSSEKLRRSCMNWSIGWNERTSSKCVSFYEALIDSGLVKVSLDAWSGMGSCHKRQKPQALTPQAPIRNRQTRKVANAKGLNCNTNLT